MKAILYVGFYRNTEVPVELNNEDVYNGYKYIECLECEGRGIWDYVDYIPIENCVNCKGTGKILINT